MGNGRKQQVPRDARRSFEWMDVVILVIAGLGVVIICWMAHGRCCIELAVGYVLAALLCVALKVKSILAFKSEPEPVRDNQIGHTEVKNKTKKFLKRLTIDTQADPGTNFGDPQVYGLGLPPEGFCILVPPVPYPLPLYAIRVTAELCEDASLQDPVEFVHEAVVRTDPMTPIDLMIVTVQPKEDGSAYEVVLELEP